ncbi:MAG TPA: F0F1 ATP synthase subunit beta, partial [Coriobacteriia bacterium]|nr:F0F1 ATP synthase subunit beta [Coriobacteriia bacterium]
MAENKEKSPMNVGRIVRVVGPVIDVEFAPDAIPAINTALTVDGETPIGQIRLVAEVQQHLPGNQVRAVAMSSTDGLTRGMEAVDTGGAMK